MMVISLWEDTHISARFVSPAVRLLYSMVLLMCLQHMCTALQ